ncbi:hypothetical protein Z949_2707 [Sulfitobacter guttiformis KCTC 32187]|nr:hypothetical protein Z949_2707 [Sulfitobacter guttiformis KCTC 32187]
MFSQRQFLQTAFVQQIEDVRQFRCASPWQLSGPPFANRVPQTAVFKSDLTVPFAGFEAVTRYFKVE